LLNAFALKNLTASSVSSFIYLQPIVGIAYAIGTKNDTLTFINILGMLLIFLGIYLVTKKVETVKI
ncbi:MAG: EamA family transporter, partial [Flavobacteriaceae bacterium]